MAIPTRTYRELSRLETFDERYEFLRTSSKVGRATFGFERYLNQRFYTSREWRLTRTHVIARDLGNDLGIEGRPVLDRIIIHHMNPMSPEEIVEGDYDIINPEFLITTSHRTHNAIHYGDQSSMPSEYKPRQRGDTDLWPKIQRHSYD